MDEIFIGIAKWIMDQDANMFMSNLSNITDIFNKNGIEATNNGEYIQTNEHGVIDPLNSNIYKLVIQTIKKVDKKKKNKNKKFLRVWI